MNNYGMEAEEPNECNKVDYQAQSSTSSKLELTKKEDGEKSRGCCCGRYQKVAIVVLFILGVTLAVTGALFPKIFNDTVKKKLVLRKGEESYTAWLSPPVPVYMKFYVFNYTNVDDIIDINDKPSVNEVGPWTYREIRTNAVLDYNEDNITYLQNYSYVFEPTLSCSTCNENTTVVIPNIFLLTLLDMLAVKLKNPNWFTRTGIDAAINVATKPKDVFKTLPFGKAIWGYEDKFLTILHELHPLLKLAGVKMPDMTKIVLQRNGTAFAEDTGNITILTGRHNIEDVQRIVRWRGLTDSPHWLTKYGNMINGTDGSRSPPFLTRNTKLYMFVPQLCRSLYFLYQYDDPLFDIPLYRFSTTPEVFMKSSKNPDNAAFCTKKPQLKCWGSGLLPMASCQPGDPPVFMSSPHFYMGDPELSERIDGLHPDPLLHSSYINIEPLTGMVMKAQKRLQVNILARKSWITLSKAFQYDNNFLPIMVVEEVGGIDRENAEKFRTMILVPKTVLKYVHYVFITIGITMVLSSLLLFTIFLRNKCLIVGVPW